MVDLNCLCRAVVLGAVLTLGGCSTYDIQDFLRDGSEAAPADQRPYEESLKAGKAHFARSDYGLAEQNFRAAVEANPSSVNGWVGLAASYDRLSRFELATRAYDHALKLAGRTPQVLNNLGYHYLLMGDRNRANEYLQAAA